ncbi:MAG: hypothetical protein M3R24_33920 [Chloroflexota bacterium]|nr:hypothetical protein [Chloroflexota bacterium]
MLTYINPILDHNFPDPTVIRAHDGRFYAYATQTLHTEPAINIQVAWSDNSVPRVMCMDRLFFHDGLPYVSGGSPSRTPQAAPVVD